MDTTVRNVYASGDNADEASPRGRKYEASRRYSGSTRRTSFIAGFRDFMTRQRTESAGVVGAQKFKRHSLLNKNLIRVQIANCSVESVYDLREEDEALDVYNDSLAFRRPRSNSTDLLILRKTSRPLSVDVVGLVENPSDPYRQYMQVVDCYELAPHAGTIVMFDGSLKLEKAFRAMSEWGVGGALVWSEEQQKILSILTLTDLLLSLLSHSTKDSTVTDAISTNRLVTLDASCKLLDACAEFCSNHVHRIVVIESTGDVLYFLTIKRILQAVHKQHRSLHFAKWLDRIIKDSGIGTWSNLKSVKLDDKLQTAVHMMIDYRISSIPVVDYSEQLVDVLFKSNIAAELHRAGNIEEAFTTMSVSDVIPVRVARQKFLNDHDTIGSALDMVLSEENKRCVFIESKEDKQLIACISLSDFISYIMLNHNEDQN